MITFRPPQRFHVIEMKTLIGLAPFRADSWA
jgi:hypothetical protein